MYKYCLKTITTITTTTTKQKTFIVYNNYNNFNVLNHKRKPLHKQNTKQQQTAKEILEQNPWQTYQRNLFYFLLKFLATKSHNTAIN